MIGAEVGRTVRATCKKPLCVLKDHLVVIPTAHEQTAELLSRLPAGALHEDDRALLEMRSQGMSLMAIRVHLGVSKWTAISRVQKADMRMH